jgi:hypothetical protein
MRGSLGNWQGAIDDLERAIAILMSLDLGEHPHRLALAEHLKEAWREKNENQTIEKVARGDWSFILPLVVKIEEEHRAWVAKDPKNRQFGPPSPITGATK